MIIFKERYDLNKIYEKWMKEHTDINPNPESIILWMQSRGMLNEEKVRQFVISNPR